MTGFATVFTCTNGGTTTAAVKVDVFRKDGAFDATGTVNAAPGATVNFATKSITALPGSVDVNIGDSAIHQGSARITAPSGVFCAAWVVDPGAKPPESMKTLPVFKKTTQKGD